MYHQEVKLYLRRTPTLESPGYSDVPSGVICSGTEETTTRLLSDHTLLDSPASHASC